MSNLQKYENISNTAWNTEGDFYASYFEPSDTPTHTGDSGNSLQATEYVELDLIRHLLSGRLAAMTSIFVSCEVRAFMARACGDETLLDIAALDGDGIEPDSFKAATLVPFKVSKIKADAGADLIATAGLRACSPTTAPIQSQFLGLKAVNDKHWTAFA